MNDSDGVIKACCANFYQSDMVQILLGDSLHPGGLELTHHLGEVLKLGQCDRVLDVACGRGSSAVHLAEHFGCHVTGIDYALENLTQADAHAAQKGVSHLTSFKRGDAERLPFSDNSFDVVISECSLCTFPNKTAAAEEMSRMLGPGGRAGITDVTLDGALPEDIQSMLAWVACIAGAGPQSWYVTLLEDAGFAGFTVEDHREAGRTLVEDIRRKLVGLSMIASLGKLNLEDLDLKGTREALNRVADLIDEGVLGYVLIAAKKT